MADDDVIYLQFGRPDGVVIKDCTNMLLTATKDVLNENADIYDIFKYGDYGGDEDCREMIAQFLSQQYGSKVSRDNLVITAGATAGLLFTLTTLMASSKCVFVEDPTYFFTISMIRDDILKTVVPAPRDNEGIIPDALEKLLTSHKPKDWQKTESGPQCQYWASVYFVPTFNNPTSQSYSHARMQQLVALARKHDVLLIAEDMYHFLPYSDNVSEPGSLLQRFDNCSDEDYGKGHLVCNHSFSKIIAPGLRLGWIETPCWMAKYLSHTSVSIGGGCFNQYTSKLIAQIIRSGRLQEHVCYIRKIYKQRMDSVVQTLKDNLPEGCSFMEPKGGYYVWISLLPETDAKKLQEFALKNFQVNFTPGSICSPSGGYKNYVRLAVAPYDESVLVKGTLRFCKAYTEFLKSK